jgi:hypothetical protein
MFNMSLRSSVEMFTLKPLIRARKIPLSISFLVFMMLLDFSLIRFLSPLINDLAPDTVRSTSIPLIAFLATSPRLVLSASYLKSNDEPNLNEAVML